MKITNWLPRQHKIFEVPEHTNDFLCEHPDCLKESEVFIGTVKRGRGRPKKMCHQRISRRAER